jgi:outer membrane protein assembly factor BamB
MDRSGGKVIWKHSANGPILHSPACSDDLVIVGDAGGTLWALSQAEGKVAWKFTSGKGGFSASPLITSDAVYLGSRDGKFYGLSLAGKLLFVVPTGGPIRCTSAQVERQIVFASDDMHAYAVDPQTG